KIPLKRFFLRKIKTSYCIAVSKGVFQYRNLEIGGNEVIYDGIFSEKEILPYSKQKENLFLFSGRLIETKGVKEMVAAFIDFSKRNQTYKLLIAGEGEKEYVESIKKIVVASGRQNDIEFLGFVKD